MRSWPAEKLGRRTPAPGQSGWHWSQLHPFEPPEGALPAQPQRQPGDRGGGPAILTLFVVPSAAKDLIALAIGMRSFASLKMTKTSILISAIAVICLLSVTDVGLAQPTPRCAAPGATIPGEVISPGWERSYKSGCPDDAGKLAGGSETFPSPMHDEPLRLIPRDWREQTISRLKLGTDDFKVKAKGK